MAIQDLRKNRNDGPSARGAAFSSTLYCVAVRPIPSHAAFLGTFAPLRRASESPMAMACLRLFTVLPLLPLLSVPFFFLCIARSTAFVAPLPYRAIPPLLSKPASPVEQVTCGSSLLPPDLSPQRLATSLDRFRGEVNVSVPGYFSGRTRDIPHHRSALIFDRVKRLQEAVVETLRI